MSTTLHLTVEEFDQMVNCGAFDHLRRKIELIRGELLEMNPAGPQHDDLILFLTSWSGAAVVDEPYFVSAQTGLDLGELESRPEPDLVWVDKRRYRDRHPGGSDVRLAVEVSYSSLNWDLKTKSKLYAEAGIEECWIVDGNASVIHVLRAPRNGEYTDRCVRRRGETLSPFVLDSALLVLDDLFGDE